MNASPQVFSALGIQLTATLGERAEPQPSARVQGGCINECYQWRCASGPLFVKVAEASRLDVLEAEAAGLQELGR